MNLKNILPLLSIGILSTNINANLLVPKIDTTNVIDDLTEAKINLNNLGSVEKIITFQEYSYSQFESKNKDYGLYVYIYNPKQIDYLFDTTLNKIEINNNKYSLKYLNSEFEKKYIKFKVKDYSISKANECNRKYDLSSYEIYDYSLSKIRSVKVAKTYTFTGEYTTNNLKCDLDELETIDLEVNHTFYRKPYDSCNSNQIDTVYFKVPNKYLNDYGFLAGVKAEWYRYRTNPIFVMKSDDYKIFSPYIGKNYADGSPDYNIVFACYDQNETLTHYENVYGGNLFNTIDFMFDGGTTGFENYKIPSGTLENYIKNYTYGNKLPCGYSERLFSHCLKNENIDILQGFNSNFENIPKDQKYGYYMKDFSSSDEVTFNATNYDPTANFWEQLKFAFTPNKEFPLDYKTIEKLDDNVNSDVYTSDKYAIDSDSLEDVKTYYNNNKTDNGIYLFRFAYSDYFNIKVLDKKKSDIAAEGVDGYLARQDVYLNFDIISLTFAKDGIFTELPVAMDPINVMAPIINYTTLSTGFLQKILEALKTILLLLVGLLIIFLVVKVILYFKNSKNKRR